MPIDSRHPDYASTVSVWRKIRTVVSGEEAVKRADDYLPRPTQMTDSDYNLYRKRAKFYSAAERTLTAFVGFVQRKEPSIIIDDDQIAYLISDIDGRGTSLDEFAGRILTEVIMMGRAGISVDVVDGRIVLESHRAESITNWHCDANGSPNLVVISDAEAVPNPDDPYVLDTRQVYRSWRETDIGVVYQKFVESARGQYVETAAAELSGPSAPVTSVPVVIVGTSGVRSDVDRSTLLPIVNLSLHHYMLSADRNWGLHFVALPTPYIVGVSPEQAPSAIGPTSMWAIPNENARVGMLEFTGAGLREISSEMEDDKREIADMGARILESRARSAESAATVSMKGHSDSANLNTICASVSDAVTRALRIGAEWVGRPNVSEIGFALNRDFLPTKIDPQELTALVQAWLGGALSDHELFSALQEGEIIDPNKTFDAHADEIGQTQSARGGVMVRTNAGTDLG